MTYFNNGRADPWSGNYLMKEREKACFYHAPFVILNRRFCESCQKFKPRRGLAFKGWKCDDCMGV